MRCHCLHAIPTKHRDWACYAPKRGAGLQIGKGFLHEFGTFSIQGQVMGMILPRQTILKPHDFHDTKPVLAMSNHWFPPHHQRKEMVVSWERSSLGDGSAPHSDCSSADQAILNSASFDAKHERRWWYPRFFGSFWWYLHVFARDPKSKIRRFPGGGAGRTRKLLDGLHFPRRVAIWKILVD